MNLTRAAVTQNENLHENPIPVIENRSPQKNGSSKPSSVHRCATAAGARSPALDNAFLVASRNPRLLVRLGGSSLPRAAQSFPGRKTRPPLLETAKTKFLYVFMTSRWAPRLLLHLCGSSLPRGGHRFPGRVSGRPRCCPPLRDCPLPPGAFRLPLVLAETPGQKMLQGIKTGIPVGLCESRITFFSFTLAMVVSF